jgi:S-DNA-T family DNA segregation ATPase FtsK/SpoIIIE
LTQATRVDRLNFTDYLDRALRDGVLWSIICLALYLVLALATYAPTDPGWSYIGPETAVSNAGGRTGAWFADVAFFLVGLLAYLLPPMIAGSAWLALRRGDAEPETRLYWLAMRWIGFVLAMGAGTGLAAIQLPALAPWLPNGVGGGLGLLVQQYAIATFGDQGATLVLSGVLMVAFSLLTGASPLILLDGIGELTLWLLRPILSFRPRLPTLTLTRARNDDGMDERFDEVAADEDMDFDRADAAAPAAASDTGSASLPAQLRLQFQPASDSDAALGAAQPAGAKTSERDIGVEELEPAADLPAEAQQDAPQRHRWPLPRVLRALGLGQSAEDPPSNLPKPAVKRDVPLAAKPRTRLQPGPAAPRGENSLPPLDLLDAPRKSGRGYTEEQLEDMSRELEARLKDFNVVAEVVAVHPGPVVALFELELAPGTKVSKITGLAKDLARALSKISVRVVEVIPGKSVIGLEIPNDEREMVVLSEVLTAEVYQDAKSPLTIGMGTNIAGRPVVADLNRMPHALIAGTTGSGKSVAINAIILSLVYKATADDVRLIMVDPKMLELSVYEGIPHLLTPVVTDMKEAANALRWCVGEMERRYKVMSKLGVRNTAGYNRKVQDAIDAGTPIQDPLFQPPNDLFDAADQGEPPTLERLPYIVVIIDELADMMMVVGKKVEELIARLAQKARAAGIHLLLATQRPSVDVLTGLIKANIPTRMAFKVSSRVDSRTILDQMGAEHLLGHGDMLYLPPGGSIPQRVHGAFVDDAEVHRVVDFLKQFGPPSYIDTVLQDAGEHLPGIDPEPRGSAAGDVEDQDPLFDEAVQIVIETRRASISGVQRRLKIGYNRAARMVEEMERIGLVGPAESNGNREVLVPAGPSDD